MDFTTLDKTMSAELEIQRSRFIALAARADSEGTAREVIEAERRKYPDARHHCSAFTFLPEGWESGAMPVTRSSDDGEPSGTAGRPMLDVLVGSGLSNACVVVTRYFGGIKLGTGGLVRAYSGAVSAVLDGAPRLQVSQLPVVSFQVELSKAPALESWLRSRGLVPLSIEWKERATFRMALADIDETALATALSEQLATAITLTPDGIQTVEKPA